MENINTIILNKQYEHMPELELTQDKINNIQEIIDKKMQRFIDRYEKKYIRELNDPNGVINMKKNNFFINQLGEEFMFYSGFVRSFDSSFGKVLEDIGNSIACLTYEVRNNINSYLLPQQSQHIDFLMREYENHRKPQISDYNEFNCIIPNNIESYRKSHIVDNYFYDQKSGKHYLIELKASGDMDNKKSKSEKISLLQQYFLLKNQLIGTNETVHIFLATAYNKFGEDNEWKQDRVKQFIASEELLIGKDYWNFCCGSNRGFEIVFEQYKKNAQKLSETFDRIKKMYFE